MPNNRRLLITGNNGYIGSVMAPWLGSQGYDVVGLDTDYFLSCRLVPDLAPIPTVRRDLRDVTAKDLAGFDAVIHLAALSNDPIGNLNSAWTREINGEGTIRLAKFAKQAGVPRFIFSSSCIMYGTPEALVVDESSPLAPQTEYARSKVEAETALRQLADDRFSPTFCRNGTIYGLSRFTATARPGGQWSTYRTWCVRFRRCSRRHWRSSTTRLSTSARTSSTIKSASSGRL
jgi:nucleoside-diphosphate-sugar epimerase